MSYLVPVGIVSRPQVLAVLAGVVHACIAGMMVSKRQGSFY
jgi:hypothetical protein